MTNNIENYQPNVPKEIRKRYKKAKMRNFIGYLVCQWVHHSVYRSLNNGWFFIPSDKMVKETGLSKHTILNYESQLILDGMIEKKPGNFTDRKANEYRCTFMETAPIENCNETKTSTQKTAPINCTEDSVENEELNEKTAPIENEENCTTVTVPVPETVLNKELDTTYNKSNFIDKVGSLTVASSLQSDLNNSNMKNINQNEQKENVSCLTTVTGERTVFERIDKLFSKDGFGGLNQKVLSKAPNYNEEGRYSQGEQKGGISWFWKKWESFEEWLNTVDIPFSELRQYMRTFKHLIEHYYTDEGERKEKKANFSKQVYVVFRRYFFKEYESFSSSLSELSRQQCKQLYFKFYSEFERLFKDSDGYSETKYAFEMQYSEAFRKAYPLTYKPKPEELDPDLMYKNLSEGEESTVKTVYTHEVNKGGGSYNDLPY